jgi:hypothetical protein
VGARHFADVGGIFLPARQFAEPNQRKREDGTRDDAQGRREQALFDRVAHQQDAAERERHAADPDHPLRAEAFLQIGEVRARGFRLRLRRLWRRRLHWRLLGGVGDRALRQRLVAEARGDLVGVDGRLLRRNRLRRRGRRFGRGNWRLGCRFGDFCAADDVGRKRGRRCRSGCGLGSGRRRGR